MVLTQTYQKGDVPAPAGLCSVQGRFQLYHRLANQFPRAASEVKVSPCYPKGKVHFLKKLDRGMWHSFNKQNKINKSLNWCCGNTKEERESPLRSVVWRPRGTEAKAFAQKVGAVRAPPSPQLPWLSLWSLESGPRAISVLSHRGWNELQLEVLILEDAVESRATLGAAEWPVALAAAVLGEFHQESQPGTSSVETAKLIKCLDLLWIQYRL